jgi:Glycerol-3-phosphate acyltransferase
VSVVPALLAAIYVGALAGVIAGGARRCSGTGGRCSWRSRAAGRWLRPAAARSSALLLWSAESGAAVWIVFFALFRYASLASMAAAVSLPLAAVALGEPWPVIAFAAVAALAVVALHRPNISRLRAGTEKRFRFRRPAESTRHSV